MSAVLFEKTQSTPLQFLRYIFVGGGAAAVDTGTLYLLYARFGVHHLGAAAVGFLLGLLLNYFISILWVFQSRGNFKQEFLLFALIGLGGLGWTELILWASVDVARISVLFGKGLALGLVLIWNFWLRKKFVFSLGGRQ